MTPRIRGFTLIELLVVMAIIAIAATLIGPVAINQYERSKQTAEREQLLRMLDQYSFLSYSRNQDYWVRTEAQTLRVFDQSNAEQAVYSHDFEYLHFDVREWRVNRHGFWFPAEFFWREGERERTSTLNMPLVEETLAEVPHAGAR
ncbi:prepilin-type cleavage/methylation domain-containing protein [Pseudidiomarina sediminum]|uniref:Prepilin-type cleavage/methylation domain-containing protein n=1 Tax=Pseudidiomarina sediminum TaxID=431675 RepID=A0A432Z9F8_9GAMM|nr:prepilin-type N-terminal cleavage/methylation domain-containing protein [Pseudidiomarina sediminum]RUO74563.1 prepilin-type cleavage/methylation domain-containing protein [Pseudidiomarina sediminum]